MRKHSSENSEVPEKKFRTFFILTIRMPFQRALGLALDWPWPDQRTSRADRLLIPVKTLITDKQVGLTMSNGMRPADFL